MIPESLLRIRKQYGGTYTTIIDDCLIIPWKPLSVGEYLNYDLDLKRGVLLKEHLEDEIFQKCVLDPNIARQINTLKAGVVAVVVQHIWEYSGPTGVEAFNQDLENARQLMNLDSNRVINQCVQLILNAFNYKPEDVYNMTYETFLTRLVQAEYKMIEAGILKHPVSIQQGQDSVKKGPRPSDLSQTFDAKRLWDEQEDKKNKPKTPVNIDQPVQKPEKWWEVSPALEAKRKHNIDFGFEQKETDTFGSSGHDKADINITRAKMVEDAHWIYKDLLDGLAKKRKTKK